MQRFKLFRDVNAILKLFEHILHHMVISGKVLLWKNDPKVSWMIWHSYCFPDSQIVMNPILAQRTCLQTLNPQTSHPWLSSEIMVSGARESSRWTQTWVTLSWGGETVLPPALQCSSISKSWPSLDISSESSPLFVCLQRSSPSWRSSLTLQGLNDLYYLFWIQFMWYT